MKSITYFCWCLVFLNIISGCSDTDHLTSDHDINHLWAVIDVEISEADQLFIGLTIQGYISNFISPIWDTLTLDNGDYVELTYNNQSKIINKKNYEIPLIFDYQEGVTTLLVTFFRPDTGVSASDSYEIYNYIDIYSPINSEQYNGDDNIAFRWSYNEQTSGQTTFRSWFSLDCGAGPVDIYSNRSQDCINEFETRSPTKLNDNSIANEVIEEIIDVNLLVSLAAEYNPNYNPESTLELNLVIMHYFFAELYEINKDSKFHIEQINIKKTVSITISP